MRAIGLAILCLVLLALGGCATEKPAPSSHEQASLALLPASFAGLTGWQTDRQAEALSTFRASCQHGTPSGMGLGDAADWQPACRAALSPGVVNDAQARTFFEQNFTPWQAAAAAGGADATQGLFTGYYEASLQGSRTRHGAYQYPLLGRPDDLVMVDLGDFRPELKGQRIAGRVTSGKLKPYEDNRAISTGRLPPASTKPLAWVDSQVDVAFLQIQGSGTISLDDGTTMRVGYAAQNGYPYYAIGKELVKRGEIAQSDVSMQSIRAWLLAHPDKAQDILYSNKSYVFFQDLGPGTAANEGPKGAQGVALTPGRSLAVDHGRIGYGIPVYVAASPAQPGAPPIDRLMVAQDTGGAIRGPVRGDFFWGRGAEAAQKAGMMKSKGQMWLLLPKTVKPAAAR